ncbi:MAG TPA: hypothetical protein PLD86_07845 [Vicinamibacteria bacterium]|nr:hypothetical protein [Vicinamibacteria bacterium]
MKKLVAVLLLAAGIVPAAQSRVDEERSAMGPEPDVSSVWTGRVVKALSLGFSDLLADLYWMRAIQYYGTQKIAGTGFANLSPLLETAAELDHRFSIVYRYGAVFLSEQSPIGAGQPEMGVALLAKGADRNPGDWRLRQEQGLFTFFYLNDSVRGAEILQQASRIPGAPDWMAALAAQILSRGGELEAALNMWLIIREQSEPGILRDNAGDQIKIVRSRILARDMTEAIKAHRERTGETPPTLAALRRAGVIRGTTDLAGIEFDFDPEKGTVSISRRSPLWRRN